MAGTTPSPSSEAPSQARSRRSSLILVLVALVAVVFAGGAVLLVLRDDDSAESSTSGDASSPVDQVNSYFAAFADGDCARLAQLVTEESLSQDGATRAEVIDSCELAMSEGQFETDVAVESASLVSENGDRATVTVQARVGGGEPESRDIQLVRQGGEWRVDLTAAQDGDDEASEEAGEEVEADT